MPYEIKPLRKEDLEDAAKLFVKSFKIEREHSPLLPSRFEDVDVVLPSLNNLLSKSPGVAAVSNNKLVGFLIGLLLPFWRGRRSVWVPECANVVVGEKRKEVFRDMYARLADEWVANGCFTHLISALAHDEEVIDELFWLGFGMVAVDAIRDLGDAEGPFADVEVRRAGVNDLEAVVSLIHEYGRYMAESPTFEAWLINPMRNSKKQRCRNPHL